MSTQTNIDLKEFRLLIGRSIEQCASEIGFTPEQWEGLESGNANISLYELRSILVYINSTTNLNDPSFHNTSLFRIREEFDCVIMAFALRQARYEARITIEELSLMTGIPTEKLQNYETGSPLQFNDLNKIASQLRVNLIDVIFPLQSLSELLVLGEALSHLLTLPPQILNYFSSRENVVAIHMAAVLSQLTNEQILTLQECVEQQRG